MDQIDAILEMAQSFEPGAPDDWKITTFKLCLDENGVWTAYVRFGRAGYFDDATGATADEALTKLREKLTTHNKNLFVRVKNLIAKWTFQTKLRAVRDDDVKSG